MLLFSDPRHASGDRVHVAPSQSASITPPTNGRQVPVAFVLLLLCATPDVAASVAKRTTTDYVEEIVVTARKREEPLVRVPASISAFRGRELTERRVDDIQDIASYAPNVDIKNVLGATNPAITIRGIGLNDFAANNTQATGVYVDDVYLTSPAMMSFLMFDIAQVDIVKGPQGTLFGRNTPAGAINVRSAAPGDPSYVSLSVANYDYTELEGAFDTSIGENADFRLSARAIRRGHGWIDNLTTGTDDYGAARRTAFRGQLRLTPTQATEVSLNLHHGREHSDTLTAWKSLGVLDFAGGDPATGLCAAFLATGHSNPASGCHDLALYSDANFDDPYRGEWDTDPTFDIDTWGASIRARQAIGSVDVTSITAYESFDRTLEEDADGPNDGLDVSYDNSIRQFSQELRAEHDGPRVDWVTGAHLFLDEVRGTPSQHIDLRDWLGTSIEVRWHQETRAWALFGHMDVLLSDQLSLGVGLRHTDETREFRGGSSDLNPLGRSCLLHPMCAPGATPPVQLSSTDDSLRERNLSGELSLAWQIHDTVMTYAKASRGFKSGGFAGTFTFTSEELEPYHAEHVDAFELGAKLRLLENRVHVDAAVFHYDYQDLQLYTAPPGELTTRLTNAEEAVVDGAEVAVRARIGSRLDLRVGAGWLDTENRDPAFSGFDLPNAPRFAYATNLSYHQPLTSRTALTALVGYRHVSEDNKCIEQLPLCDTGAYELLSARVALASADDRWEVALWGENLTDEEVVTEVFQQLSLGNYIKNYGQPRTYGVTLSLRR